MRVPNMLDGQPNIITDTVLVVVTVLAPVERAQILSEWDENIDRLVEDEVPVDFLNSMEEYSPEEEFFGCGGCVFCMMEL